MEYALNHSIKCQFALHLYEKSQTFFGEPKMVYHFM